MSSNMIKAVLVAVVMITVGTIAAFIFSDEDVEKSSTKTNEPTTTTVPKSKLVNDGPYREDLEELAQGFDLKSYDDDDWVFSEVLDVVGHTLRIKDGAGIMSLYPGDTSTSDGESPCRNIPNDFMKLMTEAGDVIVWDTKGADTKICPGEIFVVGTESEVKELVEG
jgi:hypothetical protein